MSRACLDLHTSPTDCLPSGYLMEVLMGKSSINGLFSMAMLNSQRVYGVDVAYFSPHESRQFTSLYDQKPPMSLNVA